MSTEDKRKGRFKHWKKFVSETPSMKKSNKRVAIGLCIGCGKNPCGCKNPQSRRAKRNL
jgi:hypothetical protein